MSYKSHIPKKTVDFRKYSIFPFSKYVLYVNSFLIAYQLLVTSPEHFLWLLCSGFVCGFLRWIWSVVLSLRKAEKECMASQLPVKSLRGSTSSLACFCHKLLFGLGLICPACSCTALCRPSTNLQHEAWLLPDSLPSGACKQRNWRWMCFLFLFLFLWALSVLTVRGENGHVTFCLFWCPNLSCLVAESLHAMAQLAKDCGFTIWSWILFSKRYWRKEQLLLLQAMHPFRGYTAKSKWWTVNSLAEMPLLKNNLSGSGSWLAVHYQCLFFVYVSMLAFTCTQACTSYMHIHTHNTKRFKLQILSLDLYSEIYGINNLNSIFFFTSSL